MESPINHLIDEMLMLVFWKVPLIDLIRAKAVCRRWKRIVDNEDFRVSFAISYAYCPLAFMKNDFGNHVWIGYDSTSSKWERMPALGDMAKKTNPLPSWGSRNGLLCLKVSKQFSSYIIYNPVIEKQRPLPNSGDYWGASALQMVVEEETKNLKIVAIREQTTEVYNFASNSWTIVESMPESITRQTILKLKAKNGAAYSNGHLYCVGKDREGFNVLVAFNVALEKWSDDIIQLPYPGSNSSEVECQIVECGGKIVAITETFAGLVEIWIFDCNTQFSRVGEMPGRMCADVLNIQPGVHQRLPKPATNMKCTADNRQVFIWQNHRETIAAFFLLEKRWEILPSIRISDWSIRSDPELDELEVDAGFFEPTFFDPTFR